MSNEINVTLTTIQSAPKIEIGMAMHGGQGTPIDTTNIYTKSQIDTSLLLKANKSDVYIKSEVDNKLSFKPDISTVYTKAEVDNKSITKAEISYVDSQDLALQNSINSCLLQKADSFDLTKTNNNVNDLINHSSIGVAFCMQNITNNSVSVPYIFETSRACTQVRITCTDASGIYLAPTLSTNIFLYKNGNQVSSINITDASTVNTISKINFVSGDAVYAKINGSNNGVVNIVVQLTCVLA